jgi:hypothetical protein
MADRKISDLTALTTPAAGDFLPIVDISEAAAASKNKRITIEELFRGVPLGTAAAPSIAIEGNENTGVYSPGANQLAVATNGAGRLFVDANGRVGAGNSSPGSYNASADDLVVGSSGDTGVTIVSGTSSQGSIFFADGTTGGAQQAAGYLYYLHSNDSMTLGTSNSPRMTITSAGLVGIGSSAPTELLSIGSGGVNGRTAVGGSSLSLLAGGYTVTGAGSSIELGNGHGNNGDVASWLIRSVVVDGAGPTIKNNQLTFSTRTAFANVVTERVRLDSSGRLGIGDTAPDSTLTIKAATSVVPLRVSGPSSEFARIDTSGRLLVGTSSARGVGGLTNQVQVEGVNAGTYSQSWVRNVAGAGGATIFLGKSRSGSVGGVTIVNNNDQLGGIYWCGADGVDLNTAGASIEAYVDGTPGTNDMPGRLVFSTTADGAALPTERMRISNGGAIVLGGGSPSANTTVTIYPNDSNGAALADWNRADTASTSTAARFRNNATTVGSISYTNTATAYNTSSDYRLKENVTAVTGAITRLQQLKPSRFNFIADPDKTVDGFLAHEVQTIVPEAITGEKDAVDDDGNPVYQGIDQSKLVPLLTAALQEAIGEIESLKARLTAAGL